MQDKPFRYVSGKFICQKCHEEVSSLRFWHNTLDLTWQCSSKHISKVNIAKKKKKYE